MKNCFRFAIAALFMMSSLQAWAAPDTASTWPNRPVQLIVPYPPGGSSDIIGRLLAKFLGESLGQTFIVENRSGAATAIGTAYVARSAADGYTLLLADSPFVVNAAAIPATPYDPIADFTPVAMVGTSPSFLYVPSSRSKTLAEFIAAAKANPGKLSVGSAGTGTFSHLLFEVMQKEAGIVLTHVPYRGSAPALTDTVSGVVDASFSTYASAQPFVASGKLRVLAMTAPRRLDNFPGIPTFAESGMPQMTFESWWGVLGPAGMPPAIVNRLQQVLNKAVQDPEIRAQFARLSVVPTAGTPDGYQKVLKQDLDHWKSVIKDANIKID